MSERLDQDAIGRGIAELRRQRNVVLDAEACVGWLGLCGKSMPLEVFPVWVRKLLRDIRRQRKTNAAT